MWMRTVGLMLSGRENAGTDEALESLGRIVWYVCCNIDHRCFWSWKIPWTGLLLSSYVACWNLNLVNSRRACKVLYCV